MAATYICVRCLQEAAPAAFLNGSSYCKACLRLVVERKP